jgi:hypothetical protein
MIIWTLPPAKSLQSRVDLRLSLLEVLQGGCGIHQDIHPGEYQPVVPGRVPHEKPEVAQKLVPELEGRQMPAA